MCACACVRGRVRVCVCVRERERVFTWQQTELFACFMSDVSLKPHVNSVAPGGRKTTHAERETERETERQRHTHTQRERERERERPYIFRNSRFGP